MDMVTTYIAADDIFCLNGRQLPQLFIVGTEKCGLTSLAYQLNQAYNVSLGEPFIDDFGYSNRNNLRFFDEADRYWSGLEYYASVFPPCGENVITLDGSSGYSRDYDGAPATETMRRIVSMYGPDRIQQTTFAFLVCDPVQRAQSSWYGNYADEGTFAEFADQFPRNRMHNIWRTGLYSEKIQMILEEVGHLVVIPAVMYDEKPSAVLKQLMEEARAVVL